MPSPDSQECSVFGIQNLSDRRIWKLGNSIIKKKSLKARAEVLSKYVKEVGLTLVKDNNPKRHANIIGWPATKPEQNFYAIKLARKAKLILNPRRYP